MRILAALLKYDYGIKNRGESLEKLVFVPAMENAGAEVKTFWLEENGYPNDIEGLQKKLIDSADSINPNYIFFILMRDEIKIETIKKLSEKYATINWFCDDQWRFDNFTKFVAPFLNYSITMDKYSVNKFKDLGCKVIHSQWATNEFIENIDIENINYKYDISFIGGKNFTRVW